MTEATQTDGRDPVALLAAITQAIETFTEIEILEGDLTQPVEEDGTRGTVKIGYVANGSQIPPEVIRELDRVASARGYALMGNPAYGRIPGYPDLRGIVLVLEEDLTWTPPTPEEARP